MFTKHDIPILLSIWAVVVMTAWIFEPSSLVLHLVTYALIAIGISASLVWREIREEGSLRWRSPRMRRGERAATKES